MLLNFLTLLAETAPEGTEAETPKSSWIMWVLVAVMVVVMILVTIIPQRKRQKQQQNMMNSLAVGTKLMTVGGMVGRIQAVNPDDTLLLNVGTEANPTLIVIDKKAVGYVLESVQAPAPAVEEAPVVDEPAIEDAPAAEPVVEDVAALDESVFALDDQLEAAQPADADNE